LGVTFLHGGTDGALIKEVEKEGQQRPMFDGKKTGTLYRVQEKKTESAKREVWSKSGTVTVKNPIGGKRRQGKGGTSSLGNQ